MIYYVVLQLSCNMFSERVTKLHTTTTFLQTTFPHSVCNNVFNDGYSLVHELIIQICCFEQLSCSMFSKRKLG